MRLFVLSFLGMLRTFQKSKCKKLLETTIARVQILKGRREVQLRHLLRQVAHLVNYGKNRKPEIQLECLWTELCLLSLYMKIQEYCDKVRINLDTISGQRQCPIDLEESVASLCFVASRCSVFPELQELREIFAMKYGSEFVISAQELREGSHVNRTLLEFLSTKGPHEDLKEELNKYVVAKSKQEDGSILKELLKFVNRSSQANEGIECELLDAPHESEEYKQRYDLGEEENEAWILDGGVVLAQPCVHARLNNTSPSLYNMNSSYGKHTLSSQFKRIYRKMNKKETKDISSTKHVETQDHIFSDDDENDDHSFSVAKDEADDMGNCYINDTGSFEGNNDDYHMHWLHDKHIESTIRSSYEDYYLNPSSNLGLSHQSQSPLTLAPKRAPPSLPRASSDCGLPNNTISNNTSLGRSSTLPDYQMRDCIPPDYECVAARVAELSAKTLRKDLHFKLPSKLAMVL